jgi:putative sigma-54 modulation protein
MLVTVKGRGNTDVTEALESYITKKLTKLEKHFQNIKEIKATLRIQRGMHIIDVQLEGDGVLLRAEERRVSDMYASVDAVVEKLESRIHKFKSKVYGKSQDEGPRERETEKTQAMGEAFGAGEPAEPQNPSIVRVKKFVMKPMTPDEAAQQMELVHHKFFVFRDVDTEEVSVVYKRDDGNYGLIKPV